MMSLEFQYDSAIPRRDAPEFLQNHSPRETEGAGNAGCPMHPQPRVRNKTKHTSVVTTGSPEETRHSPRNGFNGLFRALPGERILVVTVIGGLKAHQTRSDLISPPPAWHQQRVSGPHGFAVRKSIDRLARRKPLTRFISPCDCHCAPDALASTASRPAFVTTRDPPLLSRRDGEGYASDLGQAGTEIFLRKGLDSQFTDLPVRANHGFTHGPTRAAYSLISPGASPSATDFGLHRGHGLRSEKCPSRDTAQRFGIEFSQGVNTDHGF